MAQIQIWTRDVKGTSKLGDYAPQHTFLIKVNDDGTREILRGGPDDDSMITGEIEIIRQLYDDKSVDWYDPSSPTNPLNYQGKTIKTSSQSEIDSLWNSAWSAAQNMNSQLYDYEALTQNCNTSVGLLADTMNLKLEVTSFLEEVDVWTPGIDKEFNHSIIDKAWDIASELIDKVGVGIDKINSWIKDFIGGKEFENSEIESYTKEAYSLELKSGNIFETIADNYNLPSTSDLFSIPGNEHYADRIIGDYSLTKPTDTINIGLSLLEESFTLNSNFNSSNGKKLPEWIENVLESISVAASHKSPLVLDLDGDGVELISVDDSNTFFDLDGNGIEEQVGWVASDDGMLVYDANNNAIDNVNELFGKDGKTGTEELAEYDSNSDGVIDSNDAIFSNLQIWQDLNQDGISQSDNLRIF